MNKDKQVLRELAMKVAEAAGLPAQQEKLKAWKALNSLKPVRPAFMIDQLPWGELNVNDELTLVCADSLCRSFEWQLRERIYRHTHMPDDRVVNTDFRVHKAVSSTGYGVSLSEDLIYGSAGSAANSHKYKNVIDTEEDIENIKYPVVSEDKEASARIFDAAQDILGDILNVRSGGVDNYGHVWDVISTLHGVETSIMNILDRPEFIHKLVSRFFDIFHKTLDQYENLGLIDAGQPLIHCTGAYIDELPGFNGETEQELAKSRYSAKNVWTYGAAQLFSMVSPEHHDEFEIEYHKKWYSRFGLGYYGCCEPLDRKVDIIKKLPNVRKISMSTWVNKELGSEAMGGAYVFSYKPNPAFLSSGTAWDAALVRQDLQEACAAASKYGNPCELILKDVSTVGGKPQRLWEWAKIAREICR